MDVFLHTDVRFATREELVAGRWRGAVLMFPVHELDLIRRLVPEERIHVVGCYGYAAL